MRLDALPSEFRGAVFDPCCGKGYTARAAVASGMMFRGIELNPKRAAVTVEWLRSHP
jgi:predicted methyltransferase